YPNPFNNETIISYELPNTEKAVLSIYNALGQKIKTLVDQYQSPGIYTVYWDGTDDSGRVVSSGVYFYSLETPQFVRMRKMVFAQ
ncbi:MAG TPA: T9SS type A sorting domain-containing protein, partial [Bacteroidetes bacterium]|nr:T9SS type A sorting domain-containing protein [Bacteroidota bacterium]